MDIIYKNTCKVQDLSDFYLCRTSKFLGVLQDSISIFKGVVYHLNVVRRKTGLEIYQTNIISFFSESQRNKCQHVGILEVRENKSYSESIICKTHQYFCS